MPAWLKSIAQWWNNWVGDKEMENSIRRHLDQAGYHGLGAKITNVRLVAIQRPGWLQIYRFEVSARVRKDERMDDTPESPPQTVEQFGLVLHDFRKSLTDVRLFEDVEQRRALFRQWAEGLIQLRGAEGLG
ncbi:hypothetical protein AB1K70_02255 [Bremerella sp. JC770]|uniref:hypothetical protein n=1 Tax=Bremerella sp. JC770 TaxID=3232137 RepID=UPI003459C4CB